VILWVASALAAEPGCVVGRLSALANEARDLDARQVVGASAAALAEACRGWNDVLEAADEIAVASSERRWALDLTIATYDRSWLEVCPDGEGVLREAIRMTRADGRAHLWDGCGLDRLAGISRDEWVAALDGLLVLPLTAAVLLPEVGVDDATRDVVVRGLVGLSSSTPQALPMVLPSFAERAPVRWSEAALASGGACVARIRVGPAGRMQRVTFLSCPEALRADVISAARRSAYYPGTAADLPVVGAFRSRWTVVE
jgi:hypothetical protein